MTIEPSLSRSYGHGWPGGSDRSLLRLLCMSHALRSSGVFTSRLMLARLAERSREKNVISWRHLLPSKASYETRGGSVIRGCVNLLCAAGNVESPWQCVDIRLGAESANHCSLFTHSETTHHPIKPLVAAHRTICHRDAIRPGGIRLMSVKYVLISELSW